MFTNEPGNGEWVDHTYDMQPLRGQSFYLYFNIYNNGGGAQQWSYLDRVSLTVCVPPPTPTLAPLTKSTNGESPEATSEVIKTGQQPGSRSRSSIKPLPTQFPTPIGVNSGESDYGVIHLTPIPIVVNLGEDDSGMILEPGDYDYSVFQTALYGFDTHVFLPMAWR